VGIEGKDEESGGRGRQQGRTLHMSGWEGGNKGKWRCFLGKEEEGETGEKR